MKHIELFDNYTPIPKTKYSVLCVRTNYKDQLRHQPMEHVFAESYFDVSDLPLVEYTEGFLNVLEENGILDFVITNRNTAIIEVLAEMQKFGWVCDGIKTVPRNYGELEWEDVSGIYVRRVL